ncbi:MAG: TonB-dependent receptor [Pseudomonadota bacterium]
MLKYSGLVTVALLAAVQGAFAQDLTLEEEPALSTEDATLLDLIVIKSATRTETPISEATVSVSVVTQDQIERQSTINNNIGDILSKTVPGFSPSTQSMTDYGQTLRGRNFLTLIDGVPQSSNLITNGRSLNSIGTTAIGQVEVIRGATAAYGFGAPGGLVNIITKKPEDGEFNANMSVGVKASPSSLTESFSYITELGATGSKNGFFYLANGSFEQTGASYNADGQRRPPDSYGTQGGKDDIMAYNVLGKLGYEHENHRIQVSVNRYQFWQDSDWSGAVTGGDRPTNSSATPAEGRLYANTPAMDNITVSANYLNDDFLGGTVDLQAYYNDNTTTFSQNAYVPVPFPPFSILFPQYKTESEKVGARATFDTPLPIDTFPLDLVWGVDFINENTQQVSIDNPTYAPEYELTGFAPFAQLSAKFLDERATLTGGLRFEHLSVDISDYTALNTTTFVPRSVKGGTLTFNEPLFNISGSFEINEMFTVFGGFAQGFQLGDLGRTLSDDNSFTDVAALQDEGKKTDSYEIGLRAFGDRWDASITGFYNESENGVTYDQSLNIVRSPEEIWGVEFTANYEVTDQIAVGGTATWMHGQFDTNNDGKVDSDLGSDRIPPLKLTAYAEYAPRDWATFRLQGLYSGSRNPDSTTAGAGFEPVDEYFIMDAFADFQINSKSKLTFGVENILNTDYVPVLNQSYSSLSTSPFVLNKDDQFWVKGPGMTFSAKYSLKF